MPEAIVFRACGFFLTAVILFFTFFSFASALILGFYAKGSGAFRFLGFFANGFFHGFFDKLEQIPGRKHGKRQRARYKPTVTVGTDQSERLRKSGSATKRYGAGGGDKRGYEHYGIAEEGR